MDLVKQIGVTEFSLVVGIVITPFIPTNILLTLDLLPIRFLLVLGLLWAITKGPFIGLLTLFLIAVLYLERNRRKVTIARYRFADIVDKNTPVQMTVEEEAVPQDTVPVREFEIPSDRIMYYIPNASCAADSNDFSPVPHAESINAKVVFPVMPQGSKAAVVYQREGFGRDYKNVI